ncbi:MAG TPA: HD domain-containing protein [Bacteroidia bacterium]|nr:HD domain-containing protein [Bacteroidia bacterium]
MKKKIFNDPVYGFITIPNQIILDLLDHPYFHRLTRIRQLGLTYLVYPGALHTRFHHALGALHLMTQAIETLRSKEAEITAEEAEAGCIAVLLHDIGHGPFSHALENVIIEGASHETLTGLFLEKLNNDFNGRLSMAIKIFNDQYPKKFLHQLVSSQLDMDRLDYLNRDSFFSGVSEGVVSNDRIIKMLNVHNDELVVEAKGIYSIEKFLIARRLMYWQVYLHKTVLAAEQMLVKIINRAKYLSQKGENLFATPEFSFFLVNNISKEDLLKRKEVLHHFSLIDDFDIFASIKAWIGSKDKILSELCRMLINRKLYKIRLQNDPFEESLVNTIRDIAKKKFNLEDDEVDYYAFSGSITNSAYSSSEQINILFNPDSYREEKIMDIADASDLPNISVMSTTVRKYFLCGVKEVMNAL